MRVYFWRGVSNFGDQLAAPLTEHFTGFPVQWAPVLEAEAVVVGSVLELLPDNWPGFIVGAGKIREDTQLSFRQAKILAVRGPLTARGIKGSFALGDPGLLADELVDVPSRDTDLGVLPHWRDPVLATRQEFARYQPLVINPIGDPLHVLRQIGRCRKLVTSSLHGVIVADAFGIPRRLEMSPVQHRTEEGGDFKFRDYNASVGVPFEVGRTQLAARGRVEDRKHEIYDALQELGELGELACC